MVSPLRRVPFVKRHKRNQKVSPQASGPSPWLGVPSLRHPSGDIASGLLRCTSSRCVRLRRTALRAHSPDECLHSAFRRGGWIKSNIKSLQGELTLGLVFLVGLVGSSCGSEPARERGRPDTLHFLRLYSVPCGRWFVSEGGLTAFPVLADAPRHSVRAVDTRLFAVVVNETLDC